MKSIVKRYLFVFLFPLFSCSEKKTNEYSDIHQVSVEFQQGKNTHMKYYTRLSSFEFIPSVGKIDSIRLNSEEWETLISHISNLKLLDIDIEKGDWGNFPEKITIYFSTKKELINLSVLSTNDRMFKHFLSLYNFKILGDDKK